ncbi:uncharacterized protein CTRU02_205806 [Colletotrichum truncatum]|uniref:Uncharacterized protein n=1 Tax=Colletotrichum truncatum TaxID=5467 RepID=A0ACC3Z525_COLTU
MKTATFVAILGATLASAATCYYTGERATADLIKYHSKRACEGYDGKRGAFQGIFLTNEVKFACVNLQNDIKLEMWVTNENSRQSFDLNDGDCTKEFANLMRDCQENGVSQGGQNTVAGWRFRC